MVRVRLDFWGKGLGLGLVVTRLELVFSIRPRVSALTTFQYDVIARYHS